MLYIHIAAVFGMLLLWICFLLRNRRQAPGRSALILLFAAGLALRLAAAGLSGGFDNDTACFAAWAERIFRVGPVNFYSDTVFTDYPPGYMYLLYPVGALRALFQVEYGSTLHLILLRLPAITCDIICGLLLCRETRRRFDGLQPLLFTAAYLLHPAILLNASVWGQVDSVYTLLIILMCLSLIRGRSLPAYASFCFGVLIKPQTLLFAPILFMGFCDQVFPRGNGFSLTMLLKNFRAGIYSFLGMLLLILPFGLENVLSQYLDTVGSYPYAAVNAYNFWGLLGLNWVSQDNTFLGLPYRFYGSAAIAAALVLIILLWLSLRKANSKIINYPLIAALFMASVFVFSVRMHERYLYPAIVLMLFSFIYLPSKKLFLCFSGFSLLHFYNTAHVLFFYDPKNYDRKAAPILLVSAGMLLFLILLWSWVLKSTAGIWKISARHFSASAPAPDGNSAACSRAFESLGTGADYLYTATDISLPPSTSRPFPRLKAGDFFLMIFITLLYSCFAMYDLGDLKAPSTSLSLTEGDSILLEFSSLAEQQPAGFAYYIAPGHKRLFTLSVEGASESSSQEAASASQVTLDKVFTWQTAELPAMTSGTNRIRLTLDSESASLLELVFLDNAGNILTPENAGDYPGIFDEQELYPKRISFRNSMYFDEIYHARTAYEFLNGLTAYENTHPPLGKLLIAGGVALFGMNPFGWRIAGTLFGIAMIPLVYLFGKRLTESTPFAALACFLFSFDFMHFTQTRLATIDVYITFFVILMYLLMYHYSRLSFYDTPLKKTLLPLGVCGVSMGLGIACKWTGVYAGAGLALIFFAILFRRYREYRYALKDPEGATGGISHKTVLDRFMPCTVRTILFCILFFVAVPVLIYLLSYLPFRDGTSDGLFLKVLHNQEYMFRYHSGLNASHPYSSPWYQWPVMQRPIWYYSGILTGTSGNGGLREGISAFGNPLVWWAGIPAALYTFFFLFKDCRRTPLPVSIDAYKSSPVSAYTHKEEAPQPSHSTALFLLTGYLAQYLPWCFVTRVTFIYHYFPSVVFIVLMIIYSLAQLKPRMKRKSFLIMLFLYGAAAFGLFLLFYPVLSGEPVEASFVNRFLRWFDSWVLTAK